MQLPENQAQAGLRQAIREVGQWPVGCGRVQRRPTNFRYFVVGLWLLDRTLLLFGQPLNDLAPEFDFFRSDFGQAARPGEAIVTMPLPVNLHFFCLPYQTFLW